MLQLLGARLRRLADTATFVARSGGEEFALAVRHHKGVAEELAEQIRRAGPGDPARVLPDTLRTTDAAMYQAKSAGGNRVVTARA